MSEARINGRDWFEVVHEPGRGYWLTCRTCGAEVLVPDAAWVATLVHAQACPRQEVLQRAATVKPLGMHIGGMTRAVRHLARNQVN
jgi:hypothetical protein